jgi:hypothetical protein
VRENAAPAIVNIEGNTCATGVFVIIASGERRARDIVATHQCRPKARCADSESRFLAMKKFSCSPASRLIGARQNRFFPRIAAADSLAPFRFARCIADHRARSMHARMRIKRR